MPAGVTSFGVGLPLLLGVLLLAELWDGVMIWLRAWPATTGLGSSLL